MKINQKRLKIGVSIIELVFALIILGVALIPMVIALAGTKQGKLAFNTRTLLQEKTVASTLMEKAVGQDPKFIELLKSKNVFIQRNPNYKIFTDITTFPESKIKYRWIFKNITYSEYSGYQMLPDGNYLIETSLELYKTDIEAIQKKPSLILGSKLLVQEKVKVPPEPYIGVMVLVDMTPSMANLTCYTGIKPLRIEKHFKINYNKKLKPDPNIIPDFSDEDPVNVLNFLSKYCTPKLGYSNCFAQPYHKYTNIDDFLFPDNTDNPSTDFNEKYLPNIANLNPESSTTLIGPNEFITFNPQTHKIWNPMIHKWNPAEYLKQLIKTKSLHNKACRNNSIPRIEMVRSSLFSFVHLIEKTHEKVPNHLKIGFLPFTHEVKRNYLLEPTLPDPDGKYRNLQKHIKSINRDNAPISYEFNLISNYDYSTDIPGAIRLAHDTLIKDKTLTKRVIILITDWNPCMETPKTLNILPVRKCILEVIKLFKIEELKTRLEIQKKIEKNKNKPLKPDDPLLIRLSKIKKNSKVLENLLYDSNQYLPHFPLYKKDCKQLETTQTLNSLAKDINEGSINNAEGKSTELYTLGIGFAGYRPAREILTNMTSCFENGEFFEATHNPKFILQFFNYMALEMNRLEKLEETKRYAYNKRLRYGRKIN